MKNSKKKNLILLAAFGALGVMSLVSCGTRDLSITDKIFLKDTAMRFDHKGAELSECSIVGQLERGRSSSSNAAGTG